MLRERLAAVEQRPWQPEDGDTRCQGCGYRYQPWFTDNSLWNEVMGGSAYGGDPGGFLCQRCFADKADEKFPRIVWRLIPQWNGRAEAMDWPTADRAALGRPAVDAGAGRWRAMSETDAPRWKEHRRKMAAGYFESREEQSAEKDARCEVCGGYGLLDGLHPCPACRPSADYDAGVFARLRRLWSGIWLAPEGEYHDAPEFLTSVIPPAETEADA